MVKNKTQLGTDGWERVAGPWDGHDSIPTLTFETWPKVSAYAQDGLAERLEAASAMRAQAWTAPARVEAPFGDWPTCDHCAHLATFTWDRTAKQLKAMAGPKVKGSKAQAEPVSHRCALHVPVIFPELGDNYRDARVLLAAAA